jgi:hypothetical protein
VTCPKACHRAAQVTGICHTSALRLSALFANPKSLALHLLHDDSHSIQDASPLREREHSLVPYLDLFPI